MSRLTVSEPVQLRPDPDPGSPPVGSLSPGDRVLDSMTLGDWAKVKATDKDGNPQIGWLKARHLKEVVGQTVKLHAEPLSEDFDIVTGTIEQLLEVANWRKVKVTTDAQVRVGWIDANATEAPEAGDDSGTESPSMQRGEALSLGVNEVYRQALLKAQEITKIDAAALAALIDAEADKITSGSDKGQWNRKSFNNASHAAGLTQFLEGTWLDHARDSDTLLNRVAKEKRFVTGLDAVAAGREEELLALRFDPELAIVSAAEYGLANLHTLDSKGLLPDGIGDDEKARFMYLAHHEGPTGAIMFLKRENSGSFDKFAAQVGRNRASALVDAAGGNVALAYRDWLNGYMDEKIRPAKFRKAVPPDVIVSESKALGKFDGPVIPIGRFGGHDDLVREAQQALIRLGYLDPPVDGKWGNVSNWALAEFCRTNKLALGQGFTPDIANALLNPSKLLPDIRPVNGWFDKVIAYMNRKGYWICRHPGCFNIVYLEGVDPDGKLNDDRPNVFNDLRVVFSIEPSGKPAMEAWDGTTEPGTHWTMNPMNPAGAARIKFGNYKSWVVGTHMRGRASAHEALVQVEPVSVHRDLNKDFKRTNDKVDTGLFGINQHWGYDAPKDNLGNTSAGCLVGRTKAGHRQFMARLKSDPRFDATPSYKFMSAILPGDEVLG